MHKEDNEGHSTYFLLEVSLYSLPKSSRSGIIRRAPESGAVHYAGDPVMYDRLQQYLSL